jgi:hypothetical protein
MDISERLFAGRVINLWCDFTDPPKNKYLVVACSGDSPLLFLINSLAYAWTGRPSVSASQVELSAAEHPFLEHDSHLDCSLVIAYMSEEEVLAQLRADPSRIVGKLAGPARAQMITVVQAATTIRCEHKTMIVAALEGDG